MEKRIKNYCRGKKYFWSPLIHWKIVNGDLIIRGINYQKKATELFPQFYFCTQESSSLEELSEKFSEYKVDELEEFFLELVENKILISTLPVPEDLFAGLNTIFESKYEEEAFFIPEKIKQFKDKQLGRQMVQENNEEISLGVYEDYPEIVLKRKTHRRFNRTVLVNQDSFSRCMSVFQQRKDNHEIRYYYGSAGGLYPIDIYVYIKDNRVDGVDGGLYYYSPITNSLILASNSCVITEESHFYTNQEIFRQSAFSLFFVYNADVTMPKYGGMGYFYAAIDTGIMVELFTIVSELNNIGICSIGNLKFDKIGKYFRLNEHQILLHVVEAGVKE